MALQNALSRLRSSEGQITEGSQHRAGPTDDKTEQVSQVRSVFSLEEAEKDIFDIDNDFFSGADVLLSSSHFTDGDHNVAEGDGALISKDFSQDPSADTPPASSTPLSALSVGGNSRPPEDIGNPTVAKVRPKAAQSLEGVSSSVGAAASCSPSSVEKLKSFAFTKLSSQCKSTCRSVREEASGFEPPAKKQNLDPPLSVSPVSPSRNSPRNQALVGQELLAPFVSGPDETTEESHYTTPSRHASIVLETPVGTKSGVVGVRANGTSKDTGKMSVDTSFRKPIFNPRRSVGSSSSKAAGPPFPSMGRDRSTNTLHSTSPRPSLPVWQKSSIGSRTLSQTLTSSQSSPASPFVSQQHPQPPPNASTPTAHDSTPSSSPFLPPSSRTQTPSSRHGSRHTASVSSHSSTRTFSSKSPPTHPLPPPLHPPNSSPFSTPQRASSAAPVRRRFPGPAGVLPTLAAGQSLDGVVIPTPSLPTPASTPQAKTLLATPSQFQSSTQPSTQDGSGSSDGGNGDPVDFSRGPWITMLQDLDMDDMYSAPLLKCTVARALKQASRQQLRNGKVTHLRVILKSIVPAGKNASAVLKDPTGEILCTIHQSVLEEHLLSLQPGAVAILRQVSVFSPAPRKHYLSITPDNIVTIYPPSSSSSSSSSSSTAATRSSICLTEVEKRFTDLTSAKESSTHPPQTRATTIQQSVASRTGLSLAENVYNMSQRVTSAQKRRPCVQTSAIQSSSESASSSAVWDHQADSNLPAPVLMQSNEEEHSCQPTDSIFSDQLFEDEFDSLMGDIGNGMDF